MKEEEKDSNQYFETMDEVKKAVSLKDSAAFKIDQVMQNYNLLRLTMQTYGIFMFTTQGVTVPDVIASQQEFVDFLKRKAIDSTSLTECLKIVTAYIASFKEFTLHEFVEEGAVLTSKEVETMKEEFEKMLDDPDKNKLILCRIAGIGGHFTELISKAIDEFPEAKAKAQKIFETKMALVALVTKLSITEETLADLYFPYKKAQMLNKEFFDLGIIVRKDGSLVATTQGKEIMDKSNNFDDDLATVEKMAPASPKEIADLSSALAKKLIVTEPIDNIGMSKIFGKNSIESD